MSQKIYNENEKKKRKVRELKTHFTKKQFPIHSQTFGKQSREFCLWDQRRDLQKKKISLFFFECGVHLKICSMKITKIPLIFIYPIIITYSQHFLLTRIPVGGIWLPV